MYNNLYKENTFDENFIKNIVNYEPELYFPIIKELLDKNDITYYFKNRTLEHVITFFKNIRLYIPENDKEKFTEYINQVIVKPTNLFELIVYTHVHFMLKKRLFSIAISDEVDHFYFILKESTLLPYFKKLSPIEIKETLDLDKFKPLNKYPIDALLVILIILNFNKINEYIVLLSESDAIICFKNLPCKLFNTLTEEQKDIFFSYEILQELL